MQEKFHFFWSGPFSQWYPSVFVLDGITYTHAEQYMMAEKARLFGDKEIEQQILAAKTPKGQKALGRQVRGFHEDVWNRNAKAIVYRATAAKFIQNQNLMDALELTMGTTLVEASPHDRVWGIGLSADDPRAQERRLWLGTNWLGEVLTKFRVDTFGA